MHSFQKAHLAKPYLCILTLLICTGCRTTPEGATPEGTTSVVTFSGGDGSAPTRAVIIQGAQDARAAAGAEDYWLRMRYSGISEIKRRPEASAGRRYDVVEFHTPDGQVSQVFFDITDSAGTAKPGR